MPADRDLVRKRDRRFFRDYDRWRASSMPFCNVLTGAIPEPQRSANARRHRRVLARALADLQKPPDLDQHWDHRTAHLARRIRSASLYYLLSGDGSALWFAAADLDHLLTCPEQFFCHSVCRGHQDVDLETAAVMEAAAVMELAFGDAMPSQLRQRLAETAINRGTLAGLAGLRDRRYHWTTRAMNWRTVMCGSLALAGMAFLPGSDDAHELIEYAIEGALAIIADGDRAGGWNEGPGYWEYGIGHLARFALFLRTLTGGDVDLFRHPYLQRTGDFRLAMTVRPGRVWNWSDCHKKMPSSTLLSLLARVYRRGDYQDLVLAEGVSDLWQVYYLDQSVEREPAAEQATTAYFPDLGLATMRSGGGRQSSYVGVKGGIVGRDIGHQHMDVGSLVVFADGQELLAELDPWPYAQAMGKAGGFFDRTGPRWDYDYCGSIGHNVATVSGQYRKWTYHGRAKAIATSFSAELSAVIMDTSQVYDRPVTRARRAVVTLFPDVTVVIDDVAARKPVRLQTLYHYLGRVKIADDTFTISKGSASLHAVSLAPSLDDNIILGHDDRSAHYHTEHGRVCRGNRYVYIQNLHRSDRLTFVCGLHYGKRPLPSAEWTYEKTGDGAGVVSVLRDGRRQSFAFDTVAGTVAAE